MIKFTEDISSKKILKVQFSVLMSVYFKENPDYFRQALKSNLIEQTVIPNEMILVCDGPLTSDLNRVINEFRKKCPDILKIFHLRKNRGLGYALRFGLTKCSYEYVIRSDSDDICTPQRFEKQISYFQKHPEADIISSYIDEFDSDWKTPNSYKQLPTCHKDIVKMAKIRNPINHPASAFRKTAVINIGSYMPLPYMEDYYLWVRAIYNGLKLANIPEYLVHVRVGNGMIKRRSNRECINSRCVLSKYMYEHKMINRIEYFRNTMLIRVFFYMPEEVKKLIYKLLR